MTKHFYVAALIVVSGLVLTCSTALLLVESAEAPADFDISLSDPFQAVEKLVGVKEVYHLESKRILIRGTANRVVVRGDVTLSHSGPTRTVFVDMETRSEREAVAVYDAIVDLLLTEPTINRVSHPLGFENHREVVVVMHSGVRHAVALKKFPLRVTYTISGALP